MFFLQVRFDSPRAIAALGRIRTHYPAARILVVADGDPDPAIVHAARTYGAEYTAGEWLYGIESGGRMHERMLTLFLAGRGTHLVKMDTDTRLDRRFRSLPQRHGVYGTLLHTGAPQGGCIVLPRRTARALMVSGVFRHPALQDPRTSWGRALPEPLLRGRERMGMIGFEWVLLWACRHTRTPIASYGDVHATWKEGILNADRRYAVVHPDPFLAIENRALHDRLLRAHARICGNLRRAMYSD